MVARPFNIDIEMIGAPVIIYEVSPDGEFAIFHVNRASEKYYGVPSDVLEGLEMSNFEGMSERMIFQRKRVLAVMNQCVETKETAFFEGKHRQLDGAYRWLRTEFVPILDAAGEVRRVMSSGAEITKLVETQDKMKIAIDTIGGPLILIDIKPGERFVFSTMNGAAEEFFGRPVGGIEGQEVDNFDGLDEDRVAARKQALLDSKRCIAAKAPVFSEVMEQLNDGGHRWTRHTYTPIFNVNEDAERIMLTSVDITDLIKTQKQLEDSLTKTLNEFLKICANCKSIHHEGEWQDIETYASEQMDYQGFNHGMCGKCEKALYGNDIFDS